MRILVLSHEVVGASMAGPGIRYFHLARVLAQHVPTASVTLAVPHHSEPAAEKLAHGFAMLRYDVGHWPSIEDQVGQSHVVVFNNDLAPRFPQLTRSAACLVVDGYVPLLAEWSFTGMHLSLENQLERWRARMAQIVPQYFAGDLYIVNSERQRDWWLGLLEAHGRINPYTLNQDPSLRKLIDVVPFGLPATPPQHTRNVVRNVWPSIDAQSKVAVWGGGLWPWLDPLTAIRGVALAHKQLPDLRLIFPSTVHPNPHLKDLPTLTPQAKALAGELGLLNRVVFFGDWVPYADWQNVLLESDVALMLHPATLEGHLAYRTRAMDYLWAGLPTIATQGETTGELFQTHRLGLTVGFGDAAGVADAILTLLATPRTTLHARFAAARAALTWDNAAKPLIEFCKNPWRAADRAAWLQNGEPMGNPYHLNQTTQLTQARDAALAEAAQWRHLVRRYEQGKFMRLMRWLKR
jgi:glycosyltransferase involved in cell wall biosynthesis